MGQQLKGRFHPCKKNNKAALLFSLSYCISGSVTKKGEKKMFSFEEEQRKKGKHLPHSPAPVRPRVIFVNVTYNIASPCYFRTLQPFTRTFYDPRQG